MWIKNNLQKSEIVQHEIFCANQTRDIILLVHFIFKLNI